MGRDRRRTADDQRRARFVDQDGIDFIDDGIVIAALDLLLLGRGHAVVAQVIEAELAVRPVSDVAGVLFAAELRRLVVLNTADRQPEQVEKLAHPLRVAAREIIVYGHEVRAASGQRIQIERARSRRASCLRRSPSPRCVRNAERCRRSAAHRSAPCSRSSADRRH